MDPPTQADLDTLRADLEDELLHGSDARCKAVAQAFVHRLVVDGRDTIHPTFYVRDSLPTDMTGEQRETATDGRSRAVTPTVVLRWHKAKPFSQVDSLPVRLPAPNTVIRRGTGDR